MLRILFVLFMFPFLANAHAQSYIQFIKDHAVELKNLSLQDTSLYKTYKPYDVIMVGEMHGTYEPAQFVTGLANLIADQEGKVSVGLEIPDAAMELFNRKGSDSSLYHSVFFQSKNIDGRNGRAWFEMIKALHKNPKVNLFFFDYPQSPNRDSSMYTAVLDQKKAQPKTKIITLSGNIHNRLKPYKSTKTLGAYLMADSTFFAPNKIMSINHFYRQGTMMNNTGNGLEIKTIEGTDSIFNTSVSFKNYLCPVFWADQNQYNFFLFTWNVTHSEKLIDK